MTRADPVASWPHEGVIVDAMVSVGAREVLDHGATPDLGDDPEATVEPDDLARIERLLAHVLAGAPDTGTVRHHDVVRVRHPASVRGAPPSARSSGYPCVT